MTKNGNAPNAAAFGAFPFLVMRFLLLDFLVYVADKILLNQFIVDGGLQLAQLISPGIHVGSYLAEPKGLVDKLPSGKKSFFIHSANCFHEQTVSE